MPSAPMALAGTVGADAFDHVVDGRDPETVGHIYLGYGHMVQAECLATLLTVEMGVTVVVDIMMVAAAKLVFHLAVATLDGVYQLIDMGLPARSSASAITMRLAVALMPCLASICA